MYWLLLFIPISLILEHSHVSPPVLFFQHGHDGPQWSIGRALLFYFLPAGSP